MEKRKEENEYEDIDFGSLNEGIDIHKNKKLSVKLILVQNKVPKLLSTANCKPSPY